MLKIRQASGVRGESQMIDIAANLIDKYNISFETNSRIFVDGANPSFIRALKERVEEDPNYELTIQYLKREYASVYDLQFLQQSMFVIPITFSKEHEHMLAHTKAMMEYKNGQVAINPKFTKLITSLRTAVENGEGMLDKDATSFDDCFDGFRMSLFWH
jgi:hypothetical protein